MFNFVEHTGDPSYRIITDPGTESNHGLLSTSQYTKQAKKTKKGAAEWLIKCDQQFERTGKHIFNADQRTELLKMAGKLYKSNKVKKVSKRKPKDDLERKPNETLEEYVNRFKAFVENKKAKLTG